MYPAIHLSLNTADLKRAGEFYAKLFGPPAKTKPGYLKFVGAAPLPDLHLALNEVPGLAPGGALNHLGIRVGSSGEVAAWRAQAVQRGLAVEDELGVDCCHATQDKFWVADPDGNRWEVYTVLKDIETGEAAGGKSACCTPAGPKVDAAACCATPKPVKAAACCAPSCC